MGHSRALPIIGSKKPRGKRIQDFARPSRASTVRFASNAPLVCSKGRRRADIYLNSAGCASPPSPVASARCGASNALVARVICRDASNPRVGALQVSGIIPPSLAYPTRTLHLHHPHESPCLRGGAYQRVALICRSSVRSKFSHPARWHRACEGLQAAGPGRTLSARGNRPDWRKTAD